MQDLYGIYRATPPTLTDGQQSQLAVNSRGGLVTDVGSIAADAEYETVAASVTAQVMGGAGAIGDYMDRILVIPATTSPGNILLLDNSTSITVFTGGATSVADLKPFTINVGAKSVSGAWKITTGANVSAVAFGNFT